MVNLFSKVSRTTILNKQTKNIVYIHIKKNEQNDKNERVINIRTVLLSLSSVQVIKHL